MGFQYDQIRRAAYQPADSTTSWTGRYRTLAFPEEWKGRILDLCNARLPEEAEPWRTVPTWRMDGVLQSLAPDLIVRGRGGTVPGQAPDAWLYAPMNVPDPMPDRVLSRLLTAWLRDLCPEREHAGLLRDTVRELQENLPGWREDVEVDLLGCTPTEGGTAAPEARQFQLATDALARRILELPPYDYGGGLLHFRAVPRGPRDQGAELVSQPLPFDRKGRTWWYSVRINITLHTVPFLGLPRLHIHTGIRRWATQVGRHDTLRLPRGHSTSILLRPTIPWLKGAPASDRHALAHLCWRRDLGRHGWRETGPTGILRSLELSDSFPDPEDLLRAPGDWIGESTGTRAGIVHSTHMGKHGVGSGLMPHQRSRIIEWLEGALPEHLVRVPDLRRSSIASPTPENARRKPSGTDPKEEQEARRAQARRAALAVTLRESAPEPVPPDEAPLLRVRLLWQTRMMRDTCAEQLASVLGLNGDGGAPRSEAAQGAYDAARPGNPVLLRWRTPELRVELRCLPLTDGMADGLNVSGRGPRWKALSDAVTSRRNRVSTHLDRDGASPEEPSLAMVEIDRREDFASPDKDAKFALRLGCADAGVLTQFVLVPKKTDGHDSVKDRADRAKSGWQDGFRQLGVRVLPEHTLGGRLPEGTRYAALWMVKRRKDGPTRIPRHMPVAVLVTPLAPGSGQAVVTGWDDEFREWISYPKFLLRLTRRAEVPGASPEDDGEQRAARKLWKQSMTEQRQETEHFIQRVLYSLRGEHTMLLTASQNSRLHWPWLQDGQVQPDLIRTGFASPSNPRRHLRLVRVRTAQGRETPQWWGINAPNGVNGFGAGLWHEAEGPGSDRVFYSTTGKAQQFSKSAVEADKLAPRPVRSKMDEDAVTIDTDKPAWNPALVEIAVLGCHQAPEGSTSDDGDDPEAFALAVHQLRQAPDYPDPLLLPLPLHMASLAQEYVLPTVADNGDETAALTAPALTQKPDPAEQLALFP